MFNPNKVIDSEYKEDMKHKLQTYNRIHKIIKKLW
jgi:hypothetical protein